MPSKLGPHVIRPTGDALDWARHAPVVKALGDPSALRVAGPNAGVLIYRKYFPTQDINRPGGEAMAEVAAALGAGPATHVELFNECYQRLGQGLERYVEFTREAVRWLREQRPGWTLVAFCFSTGNPEPDDWAYLREHGYGGAQVIGLHEYWGVQGFTGWNALRYRKVHEWTEGDHPPFLITECGRDRVEGGRGGWRADGLSPEAYLAELGAFEAEILKDPYVVAATPFTGGPTPDWAAFDTDPLSGWLVARTGPLPPPPPPQEPPMPDVTFGVPTVVRLTQAHGPPRTRTVGVFVHATRSGTNNTLQQEYDGTVAYLSRPDGDSAHVVVGPTEVTRLVHDDDESYHAIENNKTHLGIEIAQPTIDRGYTDFQYRAAAAVARAWCDKYGIPRTRVFSQSVRGIIGHEDSEQGKRFGKSDPGPKFDWPRFISLVRGETPMPTTTTVDIAKERDALWAIAERLEKGGYAWTGQAVKAIVALSKQEK